MMRSPDIINITLEAVPRSNNNNGGAVEYSTASSSTHGNTGELPRLWKFRGRGNRRHTSGNKNTLLQWTMRAVHRYTGVAERRLRVVFIAI
jgi:hypothetical protein